MTSDPSRPVVLTDYLTDIEARLLIGYLEEIGILAYHSGVGGSTGWPDAAGYAQVVVRQSDYEQAKRAMDEFIAYRHPEGA
ncbi:MAG: hypothetical protein ACK480_06245 [Planctomycetota bacterium]|jgi:hypothetical protein|nr:hypothetical protein [Planctomycetaceae bacterium]MCE2812504.1 hypothetical protein [Planctomycetaceae bacterium]